jgi:hypothetical protein
MAKGLKLEKLLDSGLCSEILVLVKMKYDSAKGVFTIMDNGRF